MAIAQKGDPKSQAIFQKVCASNSVGPQPPVMSGMPRPMASLPSDVSQTVSPGDFASNSSSQPLQLSRTDSLGSSSSQPLQLSRTDSLGRTWLRTPSPEFRPWMAGSRPVPVLGP